jgi:hypothetical protein
LENGIGLYGYRYIWSDQVYVGVMAQEVAEIVPDAVMYGDDGYLRVDYARLGLRLMAWEDRVVASWLPLALQVELNIAALIGTPKVGCAAPLREGRGM